MRLRLRIALRYLRVLAACVVLGVLFAPPPPSIAFGETSAWVADASGTVADEAARVASAPAPVWQSARVARRPAVRRPATSRVIVVRDRLYLRNAALLR